jgi:PKD repeat protein
MQHRQRILGALAAVCLGVASLASGLVSASPAGAATTTRSATKGLSGSVSVSGPTLTETSLSDVTVSAGALTGSLSWQQTASVSAQFDSDDVRQGRALDPVDSVARTNTGNVIVNWSVPDLSIGWPGYGPFDIGTVSLSPTGACNLQFSGNAYTCHLESSNRRVLDTFDTPGPYANAKLSADLTITPQALATLRSASVGATSLGTANLGLTESSLTDPLTVACGSTPGQHLTYALGALSTTPGISVQAALQVQVGTSIDNPDYPTDPIPLQYLPPIASPSFPFSPLATSVTLSATSTSFDFGAVQADDTPVVANAGGPYSGVEGTAITFDGTGTTSGCGTPSLHWDFSDGGSADGPTPSHTFADNGTYTGTLTATDGALSDSATFTITVADAAPVADAGPDTSTGVNQVVTFAGVGTDPSSVDQASLVYSWDFGDASVQATSAEPTHTYSLPGIYTATFTACDKDGECSSDTRQVSVVAQQPTLLLYLGDFIARSGGTATARAVVFDYQLHPVVGRTVTFHVGGQTYSAITNSRGVASTPFPVTMRRGLYGMTATFQPDPSEAQYAGSSMTVPFLVF